MAKDYINKDNPVYFSYAWANNEHPDNEKDVNVLCNLLDSNNIFYKRDKAEGENCLCDYLSSINAAENEIGSSPAVIVVISERYLTSLHCMHEWHLIRECGKTKNRVFPIILDDVKINNNFEIYKNHLESQRDNILKQKEAGEKPLKKIELEAIDEDSDFFIDDLRHLYRFLTKNTRGTVSSFRENNYAPLIEKIKEYLFKINQKDISLRNVFPTATPTNLLARYDVGEDLFHNVIEHRFFNLIGVGGCGKSSLTYLLIKYYKDDFNEMPYVTINNEAKSDIIAQLNYFLNLEFTDKEDINCRFEKIVAYLESQKFKSDEPNLLVLDVNEMSDENREFFEHELPLKISNWKILILSREKIRGFKSMNLNDIKDVAFLRKLFLKYDEQNQYSDFDKFDELFYMLFYSPILTEQLAIYLAELPKQSLQEIKEIFGDDNFKNETIEGINAINRNQKIITFLKKIVNYNSFNDKEQLLLRHFFLWQPEYIAYNVIFDLLKDVFSSNNDFKNALVTLSKRAILTFMNSNSYKLHGMLAESLREQVNSKDEVYTHYLNNIEKIIEYEFNEFKPFIDCIGNSLCKYNITNDYSVLFNVALKFYVVWIANDYADSLSNKAINIFSKRISLDKDNPEYLYSLVDTYNVFADHPFMGDYESRKPRAKIAITIGEQLPKENLKYQYILADAYHTYAEINENLEDYKMAKSNYERAISIIEQLPKDNFECQFDLVCTYYDLACLQNAHLEDYSDAIINYEKAITLNSQLTRKNPEYQFLKEGCIYYDLATLQYEHFEDYVSAKSNYKKAIKIGEQMPKDNSDCQFDLASAYYGLASLQIGYYEDFKSAKSNYKNAIAIIEKLSKNNTKYQLALMSIYYDLASLQIDYFKDFKSAKTNFENAINIGGKISKDNTECQFALVNAYYYLASLQNDYLEDFKLAKLNYENAIKIGEQMPKDNLEYLSVLVGVYDSLAMLQYNIFKDYESVQFCFKKVIVIAESLSKNSSDFLDCLVHTYYNLGKLQVGVFKDYESAELNYEKAIKIGERLPKDNPENQIFLDVVHTNLMYLQDVLIGYFSNRSYKHTGTQITNHKAYDIGKQQPVAVDLGLSVLWSDRNIGATTPWDFGDYFAWGEIEPKTKFAWYNYKYCQNGDIYKLTKYCTKKKFGIVDNKKELDKTDDAAFIHWQNGWQMPTKHMIDELKTLCKWEWVKENGIEGYRVIGKTGNSIFLPATYNCGFGGFYWSSSLDSDSYDAIVLEFFRLSGDAAIVAGRIGNRARGCSIRAVKYNK